MLPWPKHGDNENVKVTTTMALWKCIGFILTFGATAS
jgi:hypothetical protein